VLLLILLGFGAVLLAIFVPAIQKHHAAASAPNPTPQPTIDAVTGLTPAIATTIAATNLNWSPTVAAGEKVNAMNVYNEGQNLVREGNYEEALQRYLWFWFHADNSGTRQGTIYFLLNDWVDLGHHYPKARQALVEIRDQEAREFAEGNGYFALFQELAALNQSLKDENATITLYKNLRKTDPDLAKQCFGSIEGLFLKKGEYAFCLECIGDPQSAFEGYRSMWQRTRQIQARMKASMPELPRPPVRFPRSPNSDAPTPPDMDQMQDSFFVNEVRQLIEILVATDNRDQAEKIQEQAVAALDDPRLKSAIADAEKAVKTHKTRP
jgi:tetratricopeptide (TPR) repeat protein